MAVKSFSVKVVIDTDSKLASVVIPKSMLKFTGTDNALRIVSKPSTKFFMKNERLHVVSDIKDIIRTCCGCEEKTIHDYNNECVICGRTNIK